MVLIWKSIVKKSRIWYNKKGIQMQKTTGVGSTYGFIYIKFITEQSPRKFRNNYTD